MMKHMDMPTNLMSPGGLGDSSNTANFDDLNKITKILLVANVLYPPQITLPFKS
jgi:hypothetical protein